MHFIVPLTKSPHPTGRIGPTRYQDWFRSLILAKTVLNRLKSAQILIISNVHVAQEQSEAELYSDALTSLGVVDKNIRIMKEAQETIGQIDIAHRLAKNENAKLIIISTLFHYPRVRWLSRNIEARHLIAVGIPRPREAVTDLVLSLLFPLLELTGKKKWFMEAVTARRIKGKH